MKKVELNDFLGFKAPSSLTYSPSGTAFAYVLTSIEGDRYCKWLHLYKDGKDTTLLRDDGLSSFEFIDDHTINFFTSREEDKEGRIDGETFTTVYQIKVDGGESYKILDLPIHANKIARIDKTRLLIRGTINKDYPDLYKLTGKKKADVYQEIKKNKDYEILTESPFWHNGVGVVQSLRETLFLYDEKRKCLTRLLPPCMDVGFFVLQGDEVLFSADEFDTSRHPYHAIYSYSLAQGELKEVVPPTLSIYCLEKVGEDILIVGSDRKEYGLNENPGFFKLDKDHITCICNPDESVDAGILSDVEYGKKRSYKADGDYLYFNADVGFNTFLKRINAKGEIENVVEEPGSITDFDVVNGKIIFTGLYDMQLEKIYSLNKGKKKKVLSFNDSYFRNRFVSKPEYFKTNYKDDEIDGWVLYPYGYDENRKYPGILDIHGGPKCAYGEVYFHEMQVWASRGFFVFFCNPHGSNGKGNAFADLRLRMGGIDYENIMAFVDHVLARYPSIDPNRLGCTGGSYGGFMSNWILGHTDRFKAIATQRSISNWITEYGLSDIPPAYDDWTNDKDPYSEEGFENQWRQSPLRYVNNAKTPVLFIHSDQDYRCPISESYQLYTALVFKRIPARMVVFHGENHELSRAGKPSHRVKRLEEITAWMEKFLQKGL